MGVPRLVEMILSPSSAGANFQNIQKQMGPPFVSSCKRLRAIMAITCNPSCPAAPSEALGLLTAGLSDLFPNAQNMHLYTVDTRHRTYDRVPALSSFQESTKLRGRVKAGKTEGHPVGQGIAGCVAEMGKTINIDNSTNDPRWNSQADSHLEDGCSTLSMPVFNVRQHVVAVLQVMGCPGSVFNQEDNVTLESLCRYMAGVHQMITRHTRLLDRLEAMLHQASTHVLNHTDDLHEMLASLAQASCVMPGVKEARVWQLERTERTGEIGPLWPKAHAHTGSQMEETKLHVKEVAAFSVLRGRATLMEPQVFPMRGRLTHPATLCAMQALEIPRHNAHTMLKLEGTSTSTTIKLFVGEDEKEWCVPCFNIARRPVGVLQVTLMDKEGNSLDSVSQLFMKILSVMASMAFHQGRALRNAKVNSKTHMYWKFLASSTHQQHMVHMAEIMNRWNEVILQRKLQKVAHADQLDKVAGALFTQPTDQEGFGPVHCHMTRAELLQTCSREMLNIFQVERAAFYLYDQTRQELVARVNDGSKAIRVWLRSERPGIVGACVNQNTTIVDNDPYNNAKFDPSVDASTKLKTRSVMAVPLNDLQGHKMGALEVINKKPRLNDKSDDFFTDDDRQLLESVGLQFAMALQLVLLMEEKEAHAAFQPFRRNLGVNELEAADGWRAAGAKKAPSVTPTTPKAQVPRPGHNATNVTRPGHYSTGGYGLAQHKADIPMII